jgi:hypothetical protein
MRFPKEHHWWEDLWRRWHLGWVAIKRTRDQPMSDPTPMTKNPRPIRWPISVTEKESRLNIGPNSAWKPLLKKPYRSPTMMTDPDVVAPSSANCRAADMVTEHMTMLRTPSQSANHENTSGPITAPVIIIGSWWCWLDMEFQVKLIERVSSQRRKQVQLRLHDAFDRILVDMRTLRP